jgi:uncharacterized protein YecE (DUF72 family)
VRVLVGTSGWHYDDWDGDFYPERLPRKQWLAFYAERFPTVEINASFYRLPKAQTFVNWRTTVPDGFCFAVKVSRYLTHIKRLREPEEPVSRFLGVAIGLEDRFGPSLLQLPPDFAVDVGALAAALDRFPSERRVAFEPRHDSWFCQETYDVLGSRDAALVIADRSGRISPLCRTASWGYVRFHRGQSPHHVGYGQAALSTWADRLGSMWPDGDVYAYFNNDQQGWAPRNAVTLMELLGDDAAGYETRRVRRTADR